MYLLVRRVRHITAPLVLVTLAACGSGSATEEDALTDATPAASFDSVHLDSILAVDLSTPDRALRSFWDLRSLNDSTLGLRVDTLSDAYRARRRWQAAYRGVVGGAALQEFDEEDATQSFAREIVDVDQQTESRAVILARIRNTTPIPEGATPSEYDVKARRDGEDVRYVLEKDAEGWKVVQLQRRYYEGDDWNDIFDVTPSVPTWIQP